jgi:hypothetical protein
MANGSVKIEKKKSSLHIWATGRRKTCWRQVTVWQAVRINVNDNLYKRWQNMFMDFFVPIFVSAWKSTEER